MTDKKVLNVVRGTIIKVYEYPFLNDGTITSMKKDIIIQPDDSQKTIIINLSGRDNSQFSVGQRVVHVSYTWKRPANDYDRVNYLHDGRTCPNEVDEFEYVIYDELSYDQKMQSADQKMQSAKTR